MSIGIKLKPEVQARLEHAATAKGLSVEVYIEELIEQHLSQPDKTLSIGAEEIDYVLDALAEASDDRSVLSAEAYAREGITMTTTDKLPGSH